MANDRSDTPMTITGSTTLINPISSPVPITTYLVSAGSVSINATTAGTTILIPSTGTNSIYLTGLLISNGLNAGSVYMGNGLGVAAPTTTAIIIQPLYLAANGNIPWGNFQPIKVPAGNNLLVTAVSCTTLSVVATYYVAP